MGPKLSKAPVYFTIAQVRFNPILELESVLPRIQDKMRKAGYPDFKKEIVATISLGPGIEPNSPQFFLPTQQNALRYMFFDMKGTRGFVLDNTTLNYQTTEYDVFEEFSGAFFEGLAIFHEHVGLDYSERIGLRYLDAVIPREGEKLEEFLVPEVLGFSHKLDGKLAHAFSETKRITDSGSVISRVIIQNGRVGLPPDLTAHNLQLSERFTLPEGLHAIIDTDCFHDGREIFNLDSLKSRLKGLRTEIGKSFEATVTPYAFSVWR